MFWDEDPGMIKWMRDEVGKLYIEIINKTNSLYVKREG
jgi:hypothetical protein